jgi:hypothetical protein
MKDRIVDITQVVDVLLALTPYRVDVDRMPSGEVKEAFLRNRLEAIRQFAFLLRDAYEKGVPEMPPDIVKCGILGH